MASPPPRAYEEVPYDDRPVAETHPDRLWLTARSQGIALPRPEQMRVLELGCAHAVNLMPMAFHLPQAQFVGMDLSPGQIARASERIDALGLPNLKVECGDVMDYDLRGEHYDVVIAHGLFSWVPDPVRDRVLTLCKEAVGDRGLVYISYNAMPAWGVREGIRRALLEIVGDAKTPKLQVARARAGLQRLAEVTPLEGTAEGALIAEEIAGLVDKPDAYLLHEYLVPHARAYWLRDFVRMAAGAGLSLMGDVAETGLAPDVLPNTRAALSPLVEGEALATEQLADIVTFRQFRASLLVPTGISRQPDRAQGWIRETFAAAAPDEADDAPSEVTAWLRARWPADASFAQIVDGTGKSPDEVHRALTDGWDAATIQLRARALPIVATVGERPTVSELARFEAAELGFVTTPLHEYAPMDTFHVRLAAAADGTRDAGAIVDALLDDIGAGRLQLATRQDMTRAQLRAPLRKMVDHALQRLASVGLLSG